MAYLTLGGGALAPIASIIGIGAGASNLLGGGGPGQTNSQTGQYTPSGQGNADQLWQALLGQGAGASTGATNAINPVLMQAFQSMLSAPTAQEYGQLSNLAPQYGQILQNQAAQGQQNAGGLINAGNQIMNTASDPQGALFNQLQQQVTDQSRAADSARGIGMSGQSAGNENQALSNFDINWQNQQLGRQSQGLQGLESAYQGAGQQANQVGQNLTGAMDFYGMAPQYLNASTSYPMQAAQQYAGAQSGTNLLNSGWLSQIIPYLNYGQGASGNAFGQQQGNYGNIIGGLNSLGSLYSNSNPNSIYGSNNLGMYNNPIANNNQGSNWSGNADPYAGMATING